jgi:hypothetical protein
LQVTDVRLIRPDLALPAEQQISLPAAPEERLKASSVQRMRLPYSHKGDRMLANLGFALAVVALMLILFWPRRRRR